MSAPLLSVERLTKRFGGLVANSDISLDVPEGSLTAVIGPNGAGKTTFFNMISGALPPTEGRVRFAGEDITGLPPAEVARRGLVRTFQLVQLFRNMTVLENVQVGLHLVTRGTLGAALLRPRWARTQEREVAARARELLAFVGLEREADRPVDRLAYGQQRLLEMARALAAKPRLLLLDEPAAGLNTQESATLADIIRQVNTGGTTVLLIEHDMSLVMRIAQHVAVLDFGRKIAEGAPAAVQAHPDVLAAYLGGVEYAHA